MRSWGLERDLNVDDARTGERGASDGAHVATYIAQTEFRERDFEW
jgi:hypothetical protein